MYINLDLIILISLCNMSMYICTFPLWTKKGKLWKRVWNINDCLLPATTFVDLKLILKVIMWKGLNHVVRLVLQVMKKGGRGQTKKCKYAILYTGHRFTQFTKTSLYLQNILHLFMNLKQYISLDSNHAQTKFIPIPQ